MAKNGWKPEPPPEEPEFPAWDYDGGDGRIHDNESEDCLIHPLFTEMAELTYESTGRYQWKEGARWVKYEEDVEEAGKRWSKPFVPTLPLHSFQQLTTMLENDTINVQLNVDPQPLDNVWEMVTETWITNGMLKPERKKDIIQTLNSRKAHLYQHRMTLQLNGSQPEAAMEQLRRGSLVGAEIYQAQRGGSGRRNSYVASKQNKKKRRHRSSSISSTKSNSHFLKKMTSGSEAFMILIGETKYVDAPIGMFLRFSDGIVLDKLVEVALPTRFIFLLLGPPTGEIQNYRNVGRAIATSMLDSAFREIAYSAPSKEAILKGLGQYVDSSTTLPPPPYWDPSIRIEPQPMDDEEEEIDAEQMLADSGLARTGKPFGGLINDIRRKATWYLSDFKDGISIQCIATWLFLYFACLTPIITFGGLLGLATHNYMGTMETLVAACICGISFALFSGQPLLILGATGPMLVFEKILVAFCENTQESLDLNYLELRVWVGIWVGLILLVLVVVEASSFVTYITKFTEENFATLIAIIFIVEAIKNLVHIGDVHHGGGAGADNSSISGNESAVDQLIIIEDLVSMPDMHLPHNDSMLAPHSPETPSNVFLLSILLFLGTFFISYTLKEFRSSPFFPTRIRYIISDFAVIIAILGMSGINAAIGLDTPKLKVPTTFAPTIPSRGWFVSPILTKNPIWTIFAAIIPALLATILIFMDQQITAVIINRKSNKLKKGAGYHLDLFVLAILIIVNSLLGLPWLVAATVESLTNVGSLKIESESAAPGEKPHFLGVREQRLSNLLIYITVGLSVLLTPVLQYVPMPVLYGVFLYMGISALRKQELFERIQLFFMPIKYQPDRPYISQVPILKLHFFTLIQVSCLILLWVIKSISQTAILFPIMLVVMIGVRKLLDFGFTQKELAALDDPLPGAKKLSVESLDKLGILENGRKAPPHVTHL